MNINAYFLTTLLAAALFSFSAFAQTGTGMTDCSKARDPARCEARQQAREQCKEKRGSEKRHCIQARMPPPDCSKANDQARCEARLPGKVRQGKVQK